MPVARAESSDSRVIAHIDMDCFYVQVEQLKQPCLRGHPTAVVQYNSWKGGGLIAVGYEARKYGIKRSMRGDDAKKICPDIHLVQVPVARGKADLTVYRNAGSEVVSILSRKGRCERASIDEVYLDLTEAAKIMLVENPPEKQGVIAEEAISSHIMGLNLEGTDKSNCVKEWFLRQDADHRDKLLACGAIIVSELRLEVLKETEFTCSAGIAHNKMLAKLGSGMNKPAQQTVIPSSSVKKLLESVPVKKMKNLGGKLGTSLQADLGVNNVGDLLQFSEQKLQVCYGINTGTWLWNTARGMCGEEVEGRLLPKSHGSGKTFAGPQALKTISCVEKWLCELCEELSERLLCDLKHNKRIAHTLTLHGNANKLNGSESHKKFPSKSCPLRYGVAKLQEDSINLFHSALREYIGIQHVGIKEHKHQEWAITALSISASKILQIPSGTHSITRYFCYQNQTCSPSNSSDDNDTQGLHFDDQTINVYDGEASAKHQNPILIQESHDTEVCKDMLSTELAGSPPPTSFEMKPTQEMLLPSSDFDNGLEPKINEPKLHIALPGVKSDKRKRKYGTEKGSSSILNFFRSPSSCSSPEYAHDKTCQGTGASLSGKMLEGTQYPRTETTQTTRSLELDGGFQSDAWGYRKDLIDPTVLSELPPEIQEEVRAWLQPQKVVNSVKRGSSIAHYFSPTAK